VNNPKEIHGMIWGFDAKKLSSEVKLFFEDMLVAFSACFIVLFIGFLAFERQIY
jgi:hypothetical protein